MCLGAVEIGEIEARLTAMEGFRQGVHLLIAFLLAGWPGSELAEVRYSWDRRAAAA